MAKEPRSYTGQDLAETLGKADRDESGPAMKFTKAKRLAKRVKEPVTLFE